MILGTKNASGGPKIDIGGPCPKPYINVTFWGQNFDQKQGCGLERSAENRFGASLIALKR